MQSLQPLRQAPRCLSRRLQQCHLLHTTAAFQSGHSRWSKIKHDKAKVDATKNKNRSVFAQEIALASKLFGPDPEANPRLADVITKAKRAGFAKQSIENAILRGQGRSASGAALEAITVEAILPHNVACIIEAETEGRLRTLADLKHAVKEAGGNATPTSYLFAKKGRIILEGKVLADGKEERSAVDVDQVFDAALEAGALDVEDDGDGRVVVLTEPQDTKSTGATLSESLGLDIAESGIVWDAVEDTMVGLQSEDVVGQLVEFIDNVEEKESGVQGIYMNVKPGDQVSEGAWAELMSRLAI
ncbi:hypothetical protein AAFC00_005075 [Neodothiora populina]|uniref:YebC-like protein n=1 Tax=Neodothiora populina TaxID=2781224 RepID=A0ABR3PJP5_9PEZI